MPETYRKPSEIKQISYGEQRKKTPAGRGWSVTTSGGLSSYKVLLRVAEGLGIERGIMGLAYTDDPECDQEPPGEDEDVLRRQLLALDPGHWSTRQCSASPAHCPRQNDQDTTPRRVTNHDITQITAVTEHLRGLDLRFGGGGIYAAANAHALRTERLMSTTATDAVRSQLTSALIDIHSVAGWAAYDIADTSKSLAHYGRALMR